MDFAGIKELFSVFGAVDVRRMFGGAGIFADGVMLGLVHDGIIYLKADEQTIPAFKREKLAPFTYSTKTGTRSINSFWRMPERLYDDPDELAQWARQSLDVIRRGARKRAPKPHPKKKAKRRRVRR